MFNFKTGIGHLAAGKIKFDSNGKITANDLMLLGNSGFELTNVDINENGIGTITELNSNIPSYDNNIQLNIEFGKNNSNAFEIGKIYNGKIVNKGGWYTEINSEYSPFITVFYDGHGEPDGDVISSKKLNLRANNYVDFMWTPQRYDTKKKYWIGEILILNCSDFYWNGVETYDSNGELTAKGVARSWISSDILIKGNISVSTDNIGIYSKVSTGDLSFQQASIVAPQHWKVKLTDSSKSNLLANTFWIIPSVWINNKVISFATEIQDTTVHIYLSEQLGQFSGWKEIKYMVLRSK